MPYELNEIKHVRKKLGLTQTQLAEQARVSQSLIAKIESGIIDPTYSKATKIFEALDRLQKKNELKAEQIMQQRIISVAPGDDIKEALKKMKKFEISQMPVIESEKVLGMVSESDLLEALLENKKEPKVREMMEDALPIVPHTSGISVISSLIRHYPMVLVSKEGQLKGVITKRDILEKMIKA